MVSIFIILYYIVDLLTTTNPCRGALNDQQQHTAENLYPSPDFTEVNTFPEQSMNEDVDFRSFDIDQKNTLGSPEGSMTSNFWEYGLNMLTPIILVALLYAKGTSCILMSLLFLLSLFLICYQSSSRDLGNKGKSDTLQYISRLKSFGNFCRLIYMLILLLFWAILKRGDLMTTQLFSTLAVVFVIADLAFRLTILAIRTMSASSNIEREAELRVDDSEDGEVVRNTEVERLDSDTNYQPNNSGLVSNRENPYVSPQQVIRPNYGSYVSNNPITI